MEFEEAPSSSVSVSLLSSEEMRELNHRTFGADSVTDVIAFGMPHGENLVGDIYICPAVARDAAAAHEIDLEEELIRLIVHGTLHVLGHEHPDAGTGRENSPMWQRQENYVRSLRSAAP